MLGDELVRLSSIEDDARFVAELARGFVFTQTKVLEVLGRNLSGMAVHIAARIQGQAGPGEILVSGTVKDLVVGSDMTFTPRGEHDLKGVPGTWSLHAVG